MSRSVVVAGVCDPGGRPHRGQPQNLHDARLSLNHFFRTLLGGDLRGQPRNEPAPFAQYAGSSKCCTRTEFSPLAIGTISTITFTVCVPPPRITPLMGLTSS